MEGVGGLAGWQWIFILEGLITVIGGIASIFLIYNGPESAGFLTAEEKRYIQLKLAYDGSRSGMAANEEGSKKKYIKDAFGDWQVSKTTHSTEFTGAYTGERFTSASLSTSASPYRLMASSLVCQRS